MRRGVQVAEFDRANAHAEHIVAAASGLTAVPVPRVAEPATAQEALAA
jgi:rhamnose transport system ATP-binding protein